MLSRVATWGSLLRQAAEAGLRLLTRSTQQRERSDRSAARPGRDVPTGTPGPRRASRRPVRPAARAPHPRATGPGAVAYAPDLDGAADPGEIVWTWVPYEEDDGRGKDRPVLVVGREGRDLVGLMLSSQADRADDRNWVGVGAGKWDGQGRPSYVRLDRVIEVGEHEIRREGAVLDKRRFDRVAAGAAGALRLDLRRAARAAVVPVPSRNAGLAYRTAGLAHGATRVLQLGT